MTEDARHVYPLERIINELRSGRFAMRNGDEYFVEAGYLNRRTLGSLEAGERICCVDGYAIKPMRFDFIEARLRMKRGERVRSQVSSRLYSSASEATQITMAEIDGEWSEVDDG